MRALEEKENHEGEKERREETKGGETTIVMLSENAMAQTTRTTNLRRSTN